MVEWKISDKSIQYEEASDFMLQRVHSIINDEATELVWFLEHPEIYTAGTSAKQDELLQSKFPIHYTGRGGKFTYHGPGQLIVYLLLDLKKNKKTDVKLYVRNLEQVIINTLKELKVSSQRVKNQIGVWIYYDHSGYKKIAAIGIRIKKWVTFHGFSININPNLSHYNGIIPCGIKEHGVTSLFQLGLNVEKQKVINIIQRYITSTLFK